MLRIVIDTNVLISEMLFEGSVPSRAVRKAVTTAEVLLSRSMLEELANVLPRAKFDRYLPLERRLHTLHQYVESVTVVAILTRIYARRDPRDNHVLEAAINGRADVVITGDVDLLALNPFHGVRIMTPEAFLNYLPSSP